jgi:hypothetical protein
LSDILYQATCFGPRGPSSGLLCRLDTDPNSTYVTVGIPLVLQRIWCTVPMYNSKL